MKNLIRVNNQRKSINYVGRPVIYRPRKQYYHMLFEFNPYDDDDHPSVPHGDSLDHFYKIDLRNGDVYNNKREKVGHLKNSEFEHLKQDKKIRKVIVSAQKYYKEHHPERIFEEIPWCHAENMTEVLVRKAPVLCYSLKFSYYKQDNY